LKKKNAALLSQVVRHQIIKKNEKKILTLLIFQSINCLANDITRIWAFAVKVRIRRSEPNRLDGKPQYGFFQPN
jgi:hypothetical protein